MTLAGPAWARSLAEGSIGKYYEFGCEVGPDNFIWNLQPQLDCDDPLYFHKGNGTGEDYSAYRGLWSHYRGQYGFSFFLTMSKIIYINSNKDISIELKSEQNKVPMGSQIIAGFLNPKLCEFCKVCCGFTTNGVCFNNPVHTTFYVDSWGAGSGCTIGLYSTCGLNNPRWNGGRYALNDGIDIAKTLRSDNINCNTKFSHSNLLNFNTKSCGGYYYIQIRIKAIDNIRKNGQGFDLIHGYSSVGALKITGANPYVCSRFSKMMMTENTVLNRATNPATPGYLDYVGNSCFSEPFFTESYIDSDISRDRVHKSEMEWGYELNSNVYYGEDNCMIINPTTGKKLDLSKYPDWERAIYPYQGFNGVSPDFIPDGLEWPPCNPVIGLNPVD
jgi:hypothetical protein